MKPKGTKTCGSFKTVSRKKLIRIVASSTAIETGESIKLIEARLKTGRTRFKDLKLA